MDLEKETSEVDCQTPMCPNKVIVFNDTTYNGILCKKCMEGNVVYKK